MGLLTVVEEAYRSGMGHSLISRQPLKPWLLRNLTQDYGCCRRYGVESKHKRTPSHRGSYRQSAWEEHFQQSDTRTYLDCGRKESQGASGVRSQAAFGANGSVPMAGSGTHDRIGESVLVSELRMRGSYMLSRSEAGARAFS